MTLAPEVETPPAPASIDSPILADHARPALRLAYLVNQYPQPSHSFIRREIRALERLGHDVRRFTIRRGASFPVDPEDQIEQQTTRSVLDAGVFALATAVFFQGFTQPRRTLSALGLAVRTGWRSDRGVLRHVIYWVEACLLLRWLRAARVDHLHAHFGTNAAMVALLCRRMGGPTYSFTVHGPEEFDKPEFLHLAEKTAHAAFVVAVSEFGRSQLYRVCSRRDWSKIVVVRCGVDERFFLTPQTAPAARPRLVCVARLHEQKGLPILIEAIRRLVAEGVSLEVQIIGDGPLRAELASRITEYGLQHVVTLAGWRSGAEVQAALQDARALVLPSFAEGLPVVLMEALALGRPVVSTYVAGIVELVEPGKSGWLVPPGSVAALTDALRAALAASVETLTEMGEAGARRVAERHDAEREAQRLAGYFEQIVTKHMPSPHDATFSI